MLPSPVNDLKTFVPAKDPELSRSYGRFVAHYGWAYVLAGNRNSSSHLSSLEQLC